MRNAWTTTGKNCLRPGSGCECQSRLQCANFGVPVMFDIRMTTLPVMRLQRVTFSSAMRLQHSSRCVLSCCNQDTLCRLTVSDSRCLGLFLAVSSHLSIALQAFLAAHGLKPDVHRIAASREVHCSMGWQNRYDLLPHLLVGCFTPRVAKRLFQQFVFVGRSSHQDASLDNVWQSLVHHLLVPHH